MEEVGKLNRNNSLYLFALHFIFLPRINRVLESFIKAWNHHPIRTEQNWTPEQIWINGMIDVRNRELTAVADVAESLNSNDDLEWYGYDPQAPHPNDDGLSSVIVNDIDGPEDITQLLIQEIDPLAESDSFGIDLYEQALEIITKL